MDTDRPKNSLTLLNGFFWRASLILLLIFIFYRARLYYELANATGRIELLGFPKHPSLFDLLAYSETDVLVAGSISLLFQALAFVLMLTKSLGAVAIFRIFNTALEALFAFSLFSISLLLVANHRMLFELMTGISYSLFLFFFFFTGVTSDPLPVLREALSWIKLPDLVFVVISPLSALSIWAFSFRVPVLRNIAVLATYAIVFVFGRVNQIENKRYEDRKEALGDRFDTRNVSDTPVDEIQQNPVYQAYDTLTWYLDDSANSFVQREQLPSENQQASIAFNTPPFKAESPLTLSNVGRVAATNPIRNVVFFIVESGGYRRMLGSGSDIMPYTSELAKHSLSFKRHYTTMCYTSAATMSMFTGLYPGAFKYDRPDWNFPTLFTFLKSSKRDYQMLWVTSGSFRGFFPTSLILRNVPLEVWDNQNLEISGAGSGIGFVVDEVKSFEFFLRKLGEMISNRPFAGVYYFYSSHYPYYNFGDASSAIRQDLGSNLNRYLNSVNLADGMIKQVVEQLKQSGHLEDTLLVITGDHGESFGVPSGHIFPTNEDTLQSPLIIFNPQFPAAEFNTPTSHTDILPTILDALNIPYNPQLFHGESLLKESVNRRFVMSSNFMMDTAFYDSAAKKYLFTYLDAKCEEFDLASDKGETSGSKCNENSDVFRAGLSFRKYLNQIIPNYNESLSEGNSFNGQAHPNL